MPFGERGDTVARRDRLRLAQSEAMAGTIPQYQQVVASEFSEKIGEEHRDTSEAALAVVGGEDLSQRLFGIRSQTIATLPLRNGGKLKWQL